MSKCTATQDVCPTVSYGIGGPRRFLGGQHLKKGASGHQSGARGAWHDKNRGGPGGLIWVFGWMAWPLTDLLAQVTKAVAFVCLLCSHFFLTLAGLSVTAVTMTAVNGQLAVDWSTAGRRSILPAQTLFTLHHRAAKTGQDADCFFPRPGPHPGHYRSGAAAVPGDADPHVATCKEMGLYRACTVLRTHCAQRVGIGGKAMRSKNARGRYEASFCSLLTAVI